MEMLSGFEWYRDSKGYALRESHEIGFVGWQRVASMTLPEMGPLLKLRIAGLGGKRINYRPFESFPTLCVQFSKVKTPKDLLAFIEKFGLLRSDRGFFEKDDDATPGKGEDVAPALNAAKTFRILMAAKTKGPAALREAVRTNHGPFLGAARVVLRPDHTNGARIAIEAHSLLDGMWLQLGQKLAGNAKFHLCKQCREWFEVGPGTGRRLDAKYCCDDHRIEYYSRSRTKGA
jgi:hypothetical protein